ncbi:hypothetical protein NE619_17745 [Anaerovorax odorimutans]|uniref:Uncharacterized protein n=1 Tax=Anaerovorax odorimutans TaxID=109327 RepID=A0ABT1RTT4_9FIRM|nr:hypothetical protein [Anaerovorax odorimutans]MCQ4638575.1 hypothetical protein [Anaerovorax odorimutans]
MKSVGLTAYSFCVRNGNDEQYELHTIQEKTFIDIVKKEADLNLKKYVNDKDGESVFTFDEVKVEECEDSSHRKEYDCLLMRVKTGEYGVESEIIDSETGNIAHTKRIGEADVMPFGCAVLVPSGQHTRGIVVFQSIGRYGIITIMKKYIQEYLQRVDGTLRLVMEPVMPRTYASKLFEEGVLKSIRMIRYGIPEDEADRYGVDRGVKEMVEERVIKKPAGFMQRKKIKLQEFINRECGVSDIVKIDGFEMDDLKLEFKCGKRIKTISLEKVDNVVVSEDVTNNVTLEKGHPTFNSLCREMKATGEFYLREQGALV